MHNHGNSNSNSNDNYSSNNDSSNNQKKNNAVTATTIAAATCEHTHTTASRGAVFFDSFDSHEPLAVAGGRYIVQPRHSQCERTTSWAQAAAATSVHVRTTCANWNSTPAATTSG